MNNISIVIPVIIIYLVAWRGLASATYTPNTQPKTKGNPHMRCACLILVLLGAGAAAGGEGGEGGEEMRKVYVELHEITFKIPKFSR